MLPGNIPSLLVSAAKLFKTERSLRFNSPDFTRLNRTFTGSYTDGRIGTIKTSFKRANLPGTVQRLMSCCDTVQTGTSIQFDANNILTFQFGGKPSGFTNPTNTAIAETVNWHHLVCWWDTTQAIDTNRMGVTLDGVALVFNAPTYPAQDAIIQIGTNGSNNYIGCSWETVDRFFDGYLADFYYIDGAKKALSDFGTLVSGVWVPKPYSGSFGLKGFHLDFGDNTAPTDTTAGIDSNTLRCLHFDNNIMDAAGTPAAWNVLNGTAAYSVTGGKFNTPYVALGTAGAVLIYNNGQFNGLAQLTLDFWCYDTTPTFSTAAGATYPWLLTTGGTWWSSTTQNSWNIMNGGATGWTAPASVWTHFAFVFDGTNWSFYQNGVRTAYYPSAPYPPWFTDFYLGVFQSSYQGAGKYDEFRISKVARWSGASYTPPTAPYSAAMGGVGADGSVNKNHWGPINLSIAASFGNDSLVDVPAQSGVDTGVGGEVRSNYAIMNVNDAGSIFVRNGGLDVVGAVATQWHTVRATLAFPGTGHWWCEVDIQTTYTVGGYSMVGVCDMAYGRPSYPGAVAGGLAWQVSGSTWINGVVGGPTYAPLNPGDRAGIRIQNGSIYFYKQTAGAGAWALQGGGPLVTGWTGNLAIALAHYDGYAMSVNFGQRPWATTLPVAGAKSMNAFNLIPPPATSFVVTAQSSAGMGSPTTFIVQAKDASGNNTINYYGTIHFTSTAAGATLPADATLTNGVGTFSATFPALGTFTITARDTVTNTITGTSANIAVVAETTYTLTIAANTQNVNLRTLYNNQGYPTPNPNDTVICYVNPGVYVGSSSTGAYAFDVGTWPTGPKINLIVKGRIQGCGGAGAHGQYGQYGGQVGGNALLVQRPINLVVTGAQLWAGGGGGGGFSQNYVGGGSNFAGGGGGCGYSGGPAGTADFSYQYPASVAYPLAGSTEAGGTGPKFEDTYWDGYGGGPGESGVWSSRTDYPVLTAPGGPGYAVVGWANCTTGSWNAGTNTFTPGAHGGDIRGTLG